MDNKLTGRKYSVGRAYRYDKQRINQDNLPLPVIRIEINLESPKK